MKSTWLTLWIGGAGLLIGAAANAEPGCFSKGPMQRTCMGIPNPATFTYQKKTGDEAVKELCKHNGEQVPDCSVAPPGTPAGDFKLMGICNQGDKRLHKWQKNKKSTTAKDWAKWVADEKQTCSANSGTWEDAK